MSNCMALLSDTTTPRDLASSFFFFLQGQWDHAQPTPSFLAPKGGLSAMELNASEELNYAQMTKPQLHVLCYVLCGGFTNNSLAKRRGTRYLS